MVKIPQDQSDHRSSADMARNAPEAFERHEASFDSTSQVLRVVQVHPTQDHVTTDQQLEPWQFAWRFGFAPQFSKVGLSVLREALFRDDCRLIQGANTNPLPLNSHIEKEPVGACAVCYIAWVADGMKRVGEIEEFFAHVCFEADRRLGEPTACRRFLNWFDDSPRDVVRHRLLAEIEIELTALATELPIRLHVPDADEPQPAA
jgi:hypothetical protein